MNSENYALLLRSESPHKVIESEADVLVIGAGPIGCTFARQLIAANRTVVMIDAGAQLSKRPGEHLKNSFQYQRNVNLFASVIRGHLQPVSVPTNNSPVVTLDPAAFQVDLTNREGKGFIRNGQNPDQNPFTNLPGMAVTYAVGGMATHWTCATPRQHAIQRTNLIPNSDWDQLYPQAEKLLNTHTDQFDISIRHRLVKRLLRQEYSEVEDPAERPQNLPLAVERRANPELVTWSGSDTVLASLADGDLSKDPLILLPQHRCTKLVKNPNEDTVLYAEVMDLINWQKIIIHAKTYIVAANAVLTPQILFNSEIMSDEDGPLGRYLSEQPLAFCQVVLTQATMDALPNDEEFGEPVRKYRETHPEDPVPIPMNDPEPQVWFPVSEKRPWHCQIHRDAFNYGELAPNVDSRLIVDLRWFGIVEQRKQNRVKFSRTIRDAFGMPQPTFEFSLTEKDRSLQHEMMRDMLRAAGALGGFLPGSEPQFMPPGLPLHVHGTVRLGEKPETSVVDSYSKVWGYNNLYLGGNGLHPVANACNPTLTSVALALRASEHIIAGN